MAEIHLLSVENLDEKKCGMAQNFAFSFWQAVDQPKPNLKPNPAKPELTIEY